ncbi:MAG: Arc family DNA-binding protein [Bradyrhizobium sp.]
MKRPKKKPQALTGRASDKFILRLPDGMRAKIQALAEQKGRSMNSEIVAALEKYIEADDSIGLVWDAIEEIQNQIRDLTRSGRDPNDD